MAATPHQSFALVYSTAIFMLVLLGFSTRAALYPDQWPPVRLTLILHIAVMVLWFALVIHQSKLINRKAFKAHIRVGQAGIAVAVLVAITGIIMIVELNLREFIWLQVIANALNIVSFWVFFGAALAWRKDRIAHKRMILFASLALITPALARLFQPLGLEALSHPVWLVLSGAVAVFDRVSEGKVTRPTWFGLGVNLASLAALIVALALVAPVPTNVEGAHDR